MIQKKIHRPECWIENKTSRFELAQIIDHEPKMAHTEEDTKEDTNHEDCEDGSIPHWMAGDSWHSSKIIHPRYRG
jgi:hypothetical protein